MTVHGVDAVRLGLGAFLLVQPPSSAFGRPAAPAETAVLRFLAVRQVVQAVVTARTGWYALGAAVDVAHGASMVLLALAAPKRYGVAASVQALEAAALVALGVGAEQRTR